MVERYVRDVEAGGSNPLTSTRNGHLSDTLRIVGDVHFLFRGFCGGVWGAALCAEPDSFGGEQFAEHLFFLRPLRQR